MRIDFLTGKVNSLLARLTPPRNLEANRDALADEIEALTRAVTSHAPDVGFEDWWVKFEDALLANRRSRVWPGVSAFHDAARAAGSSAKGLPDAIAIGRAALRDGWKEAHGGVDIDQAHMTAMRMKAGELASEFACYGVLAAEIEERDLVPDDVMARYRKGAFRARRGLYGHEAAVAWETERKAHHERVVADRRDHSTRRERVA